MNEYMNKYGDTYLDKERLFDYTKTYLNQDDIDIDEQQIEERLKELVFEGRIVEDAQKLSLSYLYHAESFIAKHILSFNQEKNIAHADISAYLNDFQTFHSIDYTEAQKKAIMTGLNHQFSIITGGPGTGKTTVIKGIVNIYKMIYNLRDLSEAVALAAPTGKAAKRLSAATDLNATTVHKLLGFDYEGRFTKDEFNPIDAKLIIIDEVSMMDCLLAKHLIAALPNDAQVIFVGDANQLPSVGPGEVLNDLIRSDLFNVVRLDIIHRQAENSNIISLAYDILNKEINRSLYDVYEDRRFIRVNERFVAEKVIAEIASLIELGYDLWEDIQVLIPVYKGLNGIDRINDLIQQRFNTKNKHFELQYKDKRFWYHDKVMQLVNQPEDNIMNGDQGIVTGITEDDELMVDFSGNVVKYNLKDLDRLTLAYAVSIHKSQGSEFNVVILPLVRSYSIMLKRKLLYTAVTRAKDKLIMIGDIEAYRRGVLGTDIPRNTRLKDFLQKEIGGKESRLSIEDFLT